jgi:hypothetical protein
VPTGEKENENGVWIRKMDGWNAVVGEEGYKSEKLK